MMLQKSEKKSVIPTLVTPILPSKPPKEFKN